MKAAVLLVCLVLAGCGQATSAPVADDPAPTPSPTRTPTPAPTTSPTPTSGVLPLDDFPLVRGYPATNGDDGSPVEVTGTSGVRRLTFCDRRGWGPRGSTDLIGTTYTGEAEDVRGRTLARYDDASAARTVIADLRAAIEACPVEEVGGTDQVYDLMPGDSVDESFIVTHRYRSDAGFDTGLEVIGAQRLDDLVLLAFEYGEGGGSEDSINRSVGDVVEQMAALLPELCEYAAHPCSQREPAPVVVIGPDGIDGITLGMSADDAAPAGVEIEARHDGTGCIGGHRDDPSGAYAVMADIRPGVGVVTMWATTQSRTPDGVGSGSTAEEVRAAYPDATGDFSLLTTPVPGHPEHAYWFWFGRDHLVTEVMLMLPDQRCYG